MTDNRGWHKKYIVRRTDRSDFHQGGKHYGCEYFVLDITHDPHATVALLSYADACDFDKPALAEDIRKMVLARTAPKEPKP